MKTRYLLTVFLSATGVVLAVGGCSTDGSNIDPTSRPASATTSPAACTAEQIKACPAVERHAVPERAGAGDRLLVRLLSALHLPAALQLGAAEDLPDDAGAGLSGRAPSCGSGPRSRTAVPPTAASLTGSTCDPEKCGAMRRTSRARWRCRIAGRTWMPIVVGETPDCCPIYQCPCAKTTDPTTARRPTGSSRAAAARRPTARRVKRSSAPARTSAAGRARCQPAHGVCTTDADCSSDARCDLSSCRLPPVTAAPNGADLRPERSAARNSASPTSVCADGSTAGPTRALPAERRRHLRLGGDAVPA